MTSQGLVSRSGSGCACRIMGRVPCNKEQGVLFKYGWSLVSEKALDGDWLSLYSRFLWV